jgi:hypothetical protein
MKILTTLRMSIGNRWLSALAATAWLAATNAAWAADTDTAQTVECMLPGQIHNVGGHPTMGPRRPIQTTPADCQQRGGEYTVQQAAAPAQAAPLAADANDTVRCQLPRQLRQLGQKKQYYTSVRTVTTTRASCQARNGKVLATIPGKHGTPKK